jgi:hypothetical protein
MHSTDLLRTDTHSPTVIRSTIRWLEYLTSVGWRANYMAPEVASRVQEMVMHDPVTITEREVADLQACGCTDGDIFDLILSAAAAAGLVRLTAGMQPLYLLSRSS